MDWTGLDIDCAYIVSVYNVGFANDAREGPRSEVQSVHPTEVTRIGNQKPVLYRRSIEVFRRKS
jgi:hypothetical protein